MIFKYGSNYLPYLKKHEYNDIFYLVDNSNNYGDTIRITMGNNISKRIKNFNKNRELIWIPVHCIVCVTVHACEVNNYDQPRSCEIFTSCSTPSRFFKFALFSLLNLFFIEISVQKYLLERSLKNTHFDDVDLLEVFSEEDEEGEDDWDMSTYLYHW